MNLAAIAIEKRTVSYFIVFLLVAGGLAAYFQLGQLEDPEYTVKTAMIQTLYPGASPQEVELEVTDRIEQAIQEMGEIKYLESSSQPGVSSIKVEIKPEYWSDRLPQIWDMLRRKVREIETQLPPGCQRPMVNDDFGSVFGFQLALTGDGYSYEELEDWAKDIRKELSVVDGVARVDLWGAQPKVVYLDVSQTQLTQLGLTDENIIQTLQQQNMVVDAGSLDLRPRRFRISPTGEFQSPKDIEELNIRPSILDTLQNLTPAPDEEFRSSSELIRIGDIGTVRRGYMEPPFTLMRLNGERAIGISITNIAGSNVVEVGRNIDRRIDELVPRVPVGIEIHKVHWMSDIVDDAVKSFLISFVEAVAIVLVILTLFMGWRMGVIIGVALILTILGTFIAMALMNIPLQRMSLGALIIALGMMVDNAIVVADGIVLRMNQGMDRRQAAIEAASQPAWPLLGATVVAVMAFYPIAGSPESTGEYCKSLFTVVGLSLMISWVISMTITPLQCMDMLPEPKKGAADEDPFQGKFYGVFRGILGMAIRLRVVFMAGMIGLLIASGVGFGYVEQLFFPDSSMKKIMIDFWFPEGARIQDLAGVTRQAEKKLMEDERVDTVAAFIGAGPPRFYLPVEPESPYPSYAQFIVNVRDLKEIDGLIGDMEPWMAETYPDALVALRKYAVGPGKTWQFEARISGPAIADPDELRAVAKQFTDILDDNPYAAYVRTDWRNRVQKVVPEYNQERARWASVTREDIAHMTKRAFDGRQVGLYREKDDLIPIVLRAKAEERLDVSNLPALQVRPSLSTSTVPLSQVTDGIVTEWEDPLIWRRDRRRTIKIQSNPVLGETQPTLTASVLGEFESMPLPPGYTFEWGGLHEDSTDSQKALLPGMIPAGAIMALIIVALFNAFRPPLIILFTIPFAAIGITVGLLGFQVPFGFMALLGAMSLAGMMIKNAIVLLDEVNLNLSKGKTPYDAITDAAVSRLRPVALAAATTVLGVVPLLQDVFWIGLAVVVMAGLSFGTVLTMVVVPVLYCILFRIKTPEAGTA
jgi:multidrug efflux pump subunit AcrB